MTPQALTLEDFAALGGPSLVYVRPVTGAEIIATAPPGALNDVKLAPEQTLYAVHRANGERLAVLGDRNAAIAAALAHELAPVSVH
ncbi:MAG: DUF1150 family protein [Caulobacteraceae bacterium]|jgi:hypothetical protein|nr:DUF1150 family protein [Caulobacteraceae bacterium]